LATPAELPAGRTVKGLDLQTLLKAGIGINGTSFTTYKPAVAPAWRPIGAAMANIVAAIGNVEPVP
jgi:hypothetical protein